jgi:hypothetical protein
MANLLQKTIYNLQIIVNSQLLRKLLKEVKTTYMSNLFMRELEES